MAEPKDLPTLEQWNQIVLTQLEQVANGTPSGVRCDHIATQLEGQPPAEMVDLQGTQIQADVPGLGFLVSMVKVLCPKCGIAGLRYIAP